MTPEKITVLAETAEERTKGYLRAALKDPTVKAAVHRRYVPKVMFGPAVANDHGQSPKKGSKRA